mgnify:CR=1 FL=1
MDAPGLADVITLRGLQVLPDKVGPGTGGVDHEAAFRPVFLAGDGVPDFDPAYFPSLIEKAGHGGVVQDNGAFCRGIQDIFEAEPLRVLGLAVVVNE